MTITMAKQEITIRDSQRFGVALTKALAAVSKSTVIPILTGLHIHADGECISITGSDSNTLIRVVEKGIGVAFEPVSFLVPGRMFVDIVKRLPSGDLILQITENEITLAAGKSSFEIKTMPVEEYPLRGTSPFDISFEIEPSLLVKGLGTLYAAAREDMRPVLQSICLSGDGHHLSFVATDAKRLSRVNVSIEENIEPFKNILIPANSANEIIKLLKEETDKVTVKCNDHEFCVITSTVTFSTRLMEGTYPDVDRIIPKNHSLSFTINREEFIGALERINILVQETKNRVCHMELSNQGIPNLTIKGVDSEIGKAKEQVFLGDIEGEEIKFAMNVKLLHDALKQVTSKEIRVLGTGPLAPFIIEPTDDNSVIALVLPVRIL
ncbi:DNA polymerase-3 subunit beta [Brevibacillus aydinogluensis]|uniref:DNA polymerase III subunit beta n=1 Tax=Brevibacillus aydinogluensis TaxID=927786 RepID=UPI002892F809|nr:DNA polymerase III subunit beta [Brevibacillus aydinogluensis]MDT3417106.1 DNA polymerase-3 subunit beta [Brevibacillus aydinogluensis]